MIPLPGDTLRKWWVGIGFHPSGDYISFNHDDETTWWTLQYKVVAPDTLKILYRRNGLPCLDVEAGLLPLRERIAERITEQLILRALLDDFATKWLHKEPSLYNTLKEEFER